jgi:hypothetical protein
MRETRVYNCIIVQSDGLPPLVLICYVFQAIDRDRYQCD